MTSNRKYARVVKKKKKLPRNELENFLGSYNRKKQNVLYFLQILDIGVINKDQIISVLPDPTEYRGRYTFMNNVLEFKYFLTNLIAKYDFDLIEF